MYPLPEVGETPSVLTHKKCLVFFCGCEPHGDEDLTVVRERVFILYQTHVEVIPMQGNCKERRQALNDLKFLSAHETQNSRVIIRIISHEVLLYWPIKFNIYILYTFLKNMSNTILFYVNYLQWILSNYSLSKENLIFLQNKEGKIKNMTNI